MYKNRKKSDDLIYFDNIKDNSWHKVISLHHIGKE